MVGANTSSDARRGPRGFRPPAYNSAPLSSPIDSPAACIQCSMPVRRLHTSQADARNSARDCLIWKAAESGTIFSPHPLRAPSALRPPQVRIDTHPTTSINNRFSPLADLRTDAVFNVDDDMVRLSCHSSPSSVRLGLQRSDCVTQRSSGEMCCSHEIGTSPRAPAGKPPVLTASATSRRVVDASRGVRTLLSHARTPLLCCPRSSRVKC